MKVLIVTRSMAAARRAGAWGPRLTHKANQDVKFWYEELGVERLHGARFDLIVIEPYALETRKVHDWIMACCSHPETALVHL